MMFTLRQASEIRQMSAIAELDDLPTEVNDSEVKLARQVIGNFEGDLDLSEFKDEYKAELRRIIDAKVAGEEVVEPKSEQPANVVDLMDALRRSLDAVSESKKKQGESEEVRTPRATARRRKRA